jgi:hypothetical protein
VSKNAPFNPKNRDVGDLLKAQADKLEKTGYKLEFLNQVALLRDAATEIFNLRNLVDEMLPYLWLDVDSGCGLMSDSWHKYDDCEDCRWHIQSCEWLERLESDEFAYWRDTVEKLRRK